MASANLELVRSIYAAWERGDFSSADWAHPDIEFAIAGGPAPGSWRGLAGMARGWREWLASWKDARVIADEYFEVDDERVLVFVHGTGHGRTSGLSVEDIKTEVANLFHVREGRVTRLVMYWRRERAVAEVGFSPEAS